MKKINSIIVLIILFSIFANAQVTRKVAKDIASRKVEKELAEKAVKKELAESAVSKAGKEIAISTTEKGLIKNAIQKRAFKQFRDEAVQHGCMDIAEYTEKRIVSSTRKFAKSANISSASKITVKRGGLFASRKITGSVADDLSDEAFRTARNRIKNYDKIVSSPKSAINDKKHAFYQINNELNNMSEKQAGRIRRELSSGTQKALMRTNIPLTNGHWQETKRIGNSLWIPDKEFRPKQRALSSGVIHNNPENKTWGELLKPYNVEGIRYTDGIPDLTPFSKCEIAIDYDKVLRNETYEMSNSKAQYVINQTAYKKMGENKELMKEVEKSGCSTVKEYASKNNLTIYAHPDGKVQLVPREILENLPKTNTPYSLYRNLSAKPTRYKTMYKSSLGNRKVKISKKKSLGQMDFTAEQNSRIVKQYSGTVKMSVKKQTALIESMNKDRELARLIHEDPENNIRRWLKTRNHVDKRAIKATANGRVPINARQYAGNTYYFNPSLNPGLEARLKNGNGYINLRGMGRIDRQGLKKLDSMFPEGVKFTKEGYPDFTHVAAKNKYGKPIVIDIGKLTGDRAKDISIAEQKYLAMGYQHRAGYTWHHKENSTKLILVPTEIHQLISHSGGVSTM